MQPDKYLQDLESSDKRSRLLTDLAVSTVFLGFFLFLGPLLHEASHAAVLDYLNCFYGFDAGFSLIGGVYASVEPFCTMKKSELMVFYSSGYISTVIGGGVLSLISMETDRFSRITASAASGTLLSILLSVTREGDIQNLVEVMELPPLYSGGIILALSIGVFITSLKTLEIVIDSERKE